MFLPIGDEPNPRGVPHVNYLLIGLNVLAFFTLALPLMSHAPGPDDPLIAEALEDLRQKYPFHDTSFLLAQLTRGLTAYDTFLLRWGYRPGEPSLLTLLTSMFLHGGWLHLIGNMLFLWIYGDNVEHRLGPIRYLVAYLGMGAAAAWIYGIFVPQAAANVPMVGASGAISGVLGLYFVWFPRNKVRIFFFLFPIFFGVRRFGARWVLGFYLVVENLLPVLLASSDGGVAYGAHLGGFFVGLGGALLYNLLSAHRDDRSARGLGPGAADADGGPRPEAAAVADAMRSGRPATAVTRYLALDPIARADVPVALVVELARWLAADAQPEAALALYRRSLLDHPNGPDLDRVFLGIGLALLHGKGRPTAAYQYLMDALDAHPSPEVEEEAREALRQIARLQKLHFR